MNNSVVAEKIRIILKFVGFTLATGFAGSCLIVVLATQGSNPSFLTIGAWFVLSSANFFVRYLAFVRTKGLSPDERVSLSTRAWLHTFISGCIWGAAALLFVPSLPVEGQAAFAIVLFGLNITSVPLMSDTRGISVLFLPAWLPMAFALYQSTGAIALPVAIVFMLGCVYLIAYIIKTTLDEFIEVRLQRDQALEELEHTNAMQLSLFLAASHDFRQPMQSISFYLLSVRKRLVGHADEVVNIVDLIEERIESLHHLIDETIGFAKLSMGMQEPGVEVIAAREMATQLLADFGQSTEAKGLRLRIYCSPHCYLLANRQILNRILDNLVSNAVRNTRQGGILVAFRKKGQGCSVQVWDTGFGIPEYEQERVFDAFYQGKQNGQVARKGHGLGLMIVKRLSERIDAELTLSSRVDRGTVFRLRLPTAEPPVVQYQSPMAETMSLQLEGKTVAIIDDDDSVRDSLKIVLSDVGVNVIVARHRVELLNALRDGPEVHLLLTDLHLEKEYGDEILDEVRRHYPKVKGIILTADASEPTQARLRAKGLHVLPKPINPHILLDQVASLINASESGYGTM